LRALGLVYVIAFGSLLVQVAGLIGDRGVLPASTFLAAVYEAYGARGYWLVPTLAWFDASTTALQGCCVAGLVAGALIIINRGTRAALLAAWALYVSLVGVGQAFLSFQWDSLLLEAGVLALLATWWPARIAWLFRWLLFRLLFLSGAVKLLSGDGAWRGLTALTFHFQTQPLPNIVSWYVHQLPRSVLEAGTVLTFIAELLVPLLCFAPRSGRLVAAAATAMFQVMIFATGNYTFFNLLTIAITVWLLDDRVLSRWVPRGLVALGEAGNAPPSRPWQRSLVMAASAVLVVLSGTQVYEVFRGTAPQPIASVAEALDSLRLTSRYGLFAVMTTTRPEIVFEGSEDGATWREYEFKYKPGDLRRPPPWVAPHQPRLDWQMWFAALGDPSTDRWVVSLAQRLLEGSPDVLGLLDRAPGDHQPPRYVRAQLYDYRFTTRSERAASGNWWSRQLLGPYLPPLVLDNGRLRRADVPSAP
jgi:lipase maturation factor 1